MCINDVENMARLLKNAFKVSSRSKFRSYSAKANPYEEVVKTLRLLVEQEFKNKSRNLLRNNDEHLVETSRYFVRETERTLNVPKNLHLNEDFSSVNLSEKAIEKTNEKFCDNALTKEITIREQELENESRNFFPKDEEILVFTAKHSTNELIHANQNKLLNELVSATYPQESTESVKHSKGRPTSKGQWDNESQKTKKKKSKKLKAKSSSLPEKKEIKDPSGDHLSNNLVSANKNVNLLGDMSPCENTHAINSLKHSEERTDKSTSTKSQKFEKKSKKSSVKTIKSPVKSMKSQVKSVKSPAKSEILLSADIENRKKEAKLKSAMQSLRSSIEAYVNANKMDQANKYFEYINKRQREYLDVELFNVVIAGWARLGRLDKVKDLFSLMLSESIVPNLTSYASYLEAIARSKYVDVSEIPQTVNKMKEQGFTPTELLQKCVFVGNQREKILQVLGFVERNITLPVYTPEDAYSFKLLEKLNDKNYEREESYFNYCFESEDIPKISATQMDIETAATIKIKSVNAVPEINDKIRKSREYLKTLEKQWTEVFTKKINELKAPKVVNQANSTFFNKAALHAYLLLIDTEILVNLLLQETRMLAETAEFYSPSLKQLYKDLGVKVMRHYFMSLNKKHAVTDKVHFIYKKYLCYLMNPDLCAKYSPREYWEVLKHKYCEGPTIDMPNAMWPYSLIVFMGHTMYDIMTKTICFNPNRVHRKSDDKYVTAAFRIKYESMDVKLYKQMRTHDAFAKLYRDAKLEYIDFDVSLVPMLSPPRPWVKYDSGGLLVTKVPFIRFPEHAQATQSSYYSKVSPENLNACFDSLNCLSLCPWIINKPLLNIVTKIFQDGGSEELDIPLNPANFKLQAEPKFGESEESPKMSIQKAIREYEKKKGEMTSLWFDCLYKLSIANHFRDKIFWFPHNLDFRGRVYPTPPHFNHLGSDLSRSILLFAHGKPLGKDGLDWLKIHLINLTGFKKRASHAERLQYANEILPEILDSADNPFGKSKWWMTSDKPLQTLACCMEVAGAVRHSNPEEYVSHFPIHQDGSCNGLQHYAALGHDQLGAIEVNLHPSSTPQDVYSGVAALVEKERDKDSKEGLEIAQVLNGFIKRKVVKQTVMTFVYGVTNYGARLQVLKQLKDMPEFPEKNQQEAATYLMKKIFLSIKEMFTATKKIQDWLTQCAEEITKNTGDAVEWVTPLGLPVIQPYYKQTTVRSSKFCLSKSTELLHYTSNYEPSEMPNVRKQKNGFPPNFIHSLDSTHMMLTSLLCHRKGITFVSVHDCYWTHCVTVGAMNRICRQQFVALHSDPILENLSAFFLKRYVDIPKMNSDSNQKKNRERAKMRAILSAVPEKGTFNLEQILDSEYFFS